MKIAIWCLGMLMLAGSLMAQSLPCQVKLRAGKTPDKLKLFYSGNVHADSIALGDVSNISRGEIDSIVSNFNGRFYTTFFRVLAVDSTHVLTPRAMLYYGDSMVCAVEPKWFQVDTLENISAPSGVAANLKLPTTSEFKWEAKQVPMVVVTMKEQVQVGDTVHVTITTNFPVQEVVDRLESPTLVKERVATTTSTFTHLDGKPTLRVYSQEIIFVATKPGTVAFETIQFKYKGKKVSMPIVGLEVTE